MSFATDEEIEAWIATRGIEAFRRNAENGNFSGRRQANALAYLRRMDERDANVRADRQVKAAEVQADTAKKALTLSKWALGIAIAAAFFTFCQWWFPRH